MENQLELKYQEARYFAKSHYLPDMVLYDVFKDNELLFTMVLNDNAEWESDQDVDQSLVRALGYQIERINE
jgi:hypothetical protein